MNFEELTNEREKAQRTQLANRIDKWLRENQRENKDYNTEIKEAMKTKTQLITFREEVEIYDRFKEKFPPFTLSQFLRKCMEKAINEKNFLTNILYGEQNSKL